MVATLAVLALASPLLARPCGDDVDGHGRAAACDCGDILVSSHTLSADDPVTQRTCPDTALVVRIPAGVPGATLAFGGQSLTGSMRGFGLEILAGGASGLTVTGPGIVQAFATGVFAAPGALAGVSDVLATGNARDGFAVTGHGFAVRVSEASHNGRDGFALRGDGFLVEGTRAAANGRYGYFVNGRNAGIGGALGAEAMGNARDGLAVRGRGTVVERAVTTANLRRGLRARLPQGRIDGAVSSGNFGAHGADATPRCAGTGACR